MNKYLGLFIDDDQKNFESIKRLFSLKNIQLLPYENLPQDINEKSSMFWITPFHVLYVTEFWNMIR